VSAAFVASILLGVAFLLAGGAKIAQGSAWSTQAGVLGAPTAVVPLVPWLEIVVGALLCAQLSRPIVGAVAFVMLLTFTGLLALRLAAGEHPPCACFGSWSAKPLSWKHLVRNAVLLVLAVVAVLG
jgi:uncharacterized membrane protein YphA (DoxX/SURF4 family)